MKDISIVESILFAAGRPVSAKELSSALERNLDYVIGLVDELKEEYEKNKRGIDIITVNDAYQMCTRPEYYEFIAQVTDKRNKPNLSSASLEILSIIAYNPNITKSEIETIRGVSCEGTMYKLLEYNLIEASGKLDAPGRPTTYVTTDKFLKMFGMSNLDELPELPKYKLDENQQIIIDEDGEFSEEDYSSK